MKEKMMIALTCWTGGLLVGILIIFLRITGRLKIHGLNNLKKNKGKAMILASNHITMGEPLIIPGLFFPRYLLQNQYLPFSTPDYKNVYRKWWFLPARKASVPIYRYSPQEQAKSIRKIFKLIKSRMILILFPEGGRTFKGTEFVCANGRQIRKFPAGVYRILSIDNIDIVPMWINIENQEKNLRFSFWKKTEIFIGEPISSETVKKELKQDKEYLEKIILGL